MFSLDELQKELVGYLDTEKIHLITQAYAFAERAHLGQTRVSGEAYIFHPLAVAHILAMMHMDHESIIAAMLHDVLEDTKADKSLITKQFGQSVAELVDGVSKLNQIEFATRAEAQAESFRKMILAMVRDIRVILVKLADRLHNMRTLDALPADKQRRIAKETLDIYAPIANRLGMYKMRLELEDLGLKALYPMRYRILQNALHRARGNRQDIMHNIQRAISHRLESAHIKNSSVYGREKHLFSIYQKMQHKHLAFSEIMDMYGFRVIVPTIDDCYRVLGIVHNLYKPLPGRMKDYIAIPKNNGYQSLHTSLFGPHGVPLEVQIRTEEMDHLAENGIAANWLYKNKTKNEKSSYSSVSPWLKNLEEIQSQTGNSLEFLENVKIDLFPEEVYVFTPKGEILELPAGATVVDFAYALHTDIGNQCVAGKIDRQQIIPLNTRLENGQAIEIITEPNAKPNANWLNFVVTGKARSHIRHFLKEQHRSESINLGQQLLSAALQAYGLQLIALPSSLLTQLFQESGLSSAEAWYEEIGLSHRIAALEAERVATMIGHTPTTITTSQPILIRGTERMVVQFSPCCRPIPGDLIAGILKPGQGLIIHRANCEQIAPYQTKMEKLIPVQWEPNIQGDFSSELQIDVANQRGILAMVAFGITDNGANIEDIKSENKDGHHARITLVVTVHDRKHLAKIIRRLRTLKGVLKIHRAFNAA